MPRMKKDGAFFNCYMKQDVFAKLSDYADNTGISKTAVVEKALCRYLTDVCTEKVSVDTFLQQYQTGQMVYPSVVAQHCSGVDLDTVQPVLNQRSDLVRMVSRLCPRCGKYEMMPDTESGQPMICQECSIEMILQEEPVYQVKKGG